MIRQSVIALRAIVFFTVLLGLAYPLGMTAIGQVFMSDQANGSIVEIDGTPVASTLIGQCFIDPDTGHTLPGYFRGRPSASSCDAYPSAASNLGPTSRELQERIAADVAIIREENQLPANQDIPVDLVTASGSGLDPAISLASAELQIPRVARERGMTEADVRALVQSNTHEPLLGFFGEQYVNVVELNLALDQVS